MIVLGIEPSVDGGEAAVGNQVQAILPDTKVALVSVFRKTKDAEDPGDAGEKQCEPNACGGQIRHAHRKALGSKGEASCHGQIVNHDPLGNS